MKEFNSSHASSLVGYGRLGYTVDVEQMKNTTLTGLEVHIKVFFSNLKSSLPKIYFFLILTRNLVFENDEKNCFGMYGGTI